MFKGMSMGRIEKNMEEGSGQRRPQGRGRENLFFVRRPIIGAEKRRALKETVPPAARGILALSREDRLTCCNQDKRNFERCLLVAEKGEGPV